MRSVIVLFIFLILFGNNYKLVAQETPDSVHRAIIKKLVATELGELSSYKILSELCSFGPRLTGSPNSYRAIEWSVLKLKEMGFDSVWLQPCTVKRWVRGATERCLVKESSGGTGMELTASALGGSIGGTVNAPVIELSSFDDLEKNKDNVKGKIVFFNVPFNHSNYNSFRSYGEAVQYRVFGPSRVAKYGAIGMVFSSITSRPDDHPHVGVTVYKDSIPKVPAAALGVESAYRLSSYLKDHANASMQLTLSCYTLPDTTSYNVIADMRGTTFPNEVIIAGGHFDSWDKGTGAHDDGAGCVHSMQAIKRLITVYGKTKRTLRCILFMNEENGSAGSAAYGEYAAKSSEKIYAAIESDRGGFTPRAISYESENAAYKKTKTWIPLLSEAGLTAVEVSGSGADIGRLKQCEALSGFVPDAQRYFDFHHSDNDVLEGVNARELAAGTAAIASWMYMVSEVGW